jgi:hypothetical protein
MDKLSINCISWSHVQCIVEVIEMSICDLNYIVLPAKLIIRKLKTSLGRVLTKESKYVLKSRSSKSARNRR